MFEGMQPDRRAGGAIDLFRPLAAAFARMPGPLRAIAERFDRSPVDSVAALTRFVHTRSAYIAQTSLYGYLKTRMGTSYRQYFEDETFSRSIRIASIRVFASCLADLTVFTTAIVRSGGRLDDRAAAALAGRCFRDAIHACLDSGDEAHLPTDLFDRFDARLECADWSFMASGENAFAGSARDLVRYAPVVDEYREADREIVTNSIRFRWRDVREQARKRIDGAAVASDWSGAR